jgi:2',3'-cyclic-nucleotide 2'-phosphodiesterase (5'-nucleotidase family)
VTDAMLDSSDADVAIYNVTGGIRGILPQGELTFGSLFDVLPFDNRLVVLEITGGELRQVIAHQVNNYRRRAGFSGMQVFVDCDDGHMSVTMSLPNGRDIQDGDSVSVVVNDFLALGGDDIVTPVMPDGGFLITDDLAMLRDAVGAWLSSRGGRLRAIQFEDLDNPRWNLPDPLPATCSL